MESDLFISYSHGDGGEHARRLADGLRSEPPHYRAWIDERQLGGGAVWDIRLEEAIARCTALLFVVTAESVQPTSQCRQEWFRALEVGKPVVPLRFHPTARLPLRLADRQYIDFTVEFDVGLARLRTQLRDVNVATAVLADLEERALMAEQELLDSASAGASAGRLRRLEETIAMLHARIAKQRQLVADPAGERERAQATIQQGIEASAVRPTSSDAPAVRVKKINTAPFLPPTHFEDRDKQTKLTLDYLRDDSIRLVTVFGRSGMGKTTTVCRLLTSIEQADASGTSLTSEALGPGLAIDGIVYLSPGSGRPLSFAHLFSDLCKLLPIETAQQLDVRFRDPFETPSSLMGALLKELASTRTIVLLDDFHNVVDVTTGNVTDDLLDAALRTVLEAPPHGVKVLLTTQVAPGKLALLHPGRQGRIAHDEGLPEPHAARVLRALDPDASLGLAEAPEQLLTEAVTRTGGQPKALELVAGFLASDRATSLSDLLANTEPWNYIGGELVGKTFSQLDTLMQNVVQALAVFDSPVPATAVDYLLQPYRPAVDSSLVLGPLVNMLFVRRDAGQYHLHQAERDYALAQLPVGTLGDSASESPPFSRRALRRRAADYYRLLGQQQPEETWRSLDDISPQIAELKMRCLAGQADEAAQVLIDVSKYLFNWGHYRLTLQLRDIISDDIVDPWTRGALHNVVGGCQRHIGDLDAAVESFKLSLAVDLELNDDKGAMASLNNLGACSYISGDLPRAFEYYERALELAQAASNGHHIASNLTGLALCHSRVGDDSRALQRLHGALDILRGRREARAGAELLHIGACHRRLGRRTQALECAQEALEICRGAGNRAMEAHCLCSLAELSADASNWSDAVNKYEFATAIAKAIGNREAESDARLGLAGVRLWAGEPADALGPAREAAGVLWPQQRSRAELILGVACLQLGDDEARVHFEAAVRHADQQLALTPQMYEELETKATALCGLALLGDPSLVQLAVELFTKARQITSAPGCVRDALRMLDCVAKRDGRGMLREARSAAGG